MRISILVARVICLTAPVDNKNYMLDWRYSDGRSLGHFIVYCTKVFIKSHLHLFT